MPPAVPAIPGLKECPLPRESGTHATLGKTEFSCHLPNREQHHRICSCLRFLRCGLVHRRCPLYASPAS
jgi:hypothetical protein